MPKKAIIICGPTASGKTEFAHYIAKKYQGEVVNADSMQIYRQIPIITSSPSKKLKTELPYYLYNFLDIEEEFSAIRYSQNAAQKIREISCSGALPIIVGGSGLYINALIYGYNKIPLITDEIRNEGKNLYNKVGAEEFWQKLILLDPLAQNRLKIVDTQRILRAFEVINQTGKSIFLYMEESNFIPLPEFEFKILFLLPQREFLYNNCNERVKALLKEGAIEEISRIKERLILCKNSAIKALGVQEIINYLHNKITYQELVEIISLNTRRYAKRQITWFKNQIKKKETIEYKNMAEFKVKLKSLNNIISP